MKPATVRRTDLRYRIGLNLRAVVGRSYPRIVGANREPSWIFFEAILPLLGIAAYVFIYGALGHRALVGVSDLAEIARIQARTNSLIATVVLGGPMVAFWLNVLWSIESQL